MHKQQFEKWNVQIHVCESHEKSFLETWFNKFWLNDLPVLWKWSVWGGPESSVFTEFILFPLILEQTQLLLRMSYGCCCELCRDHSLAVNWGVKAEKLLCDTSILTF